ncbi:hypothetical protein AMECASPLE_025872 [Ameca splendens]|uniref:Uncharacterized protein n=1 Tax=Ameca splendens TaxID=208324 RepID=A0ABV1AB30_9TELE
MKCRSMSQKQFMTLRISLPRPSPLAAPHLTLHPASTLLHHYEEEESPLAVGGLPPILFYAALLAFIFKIFSVSKTKASVYGPKTLRLRHVPRPPVTFLSRTPGAKFDQQISLLLVMHASNCGLPSSRSLSQSDPSSLRPVCHGRPCQGPKPQTTYPSWIIGCSEEEERETLTAGGDSEEGGGGGSGRDECIYRSRDEEVERQQGEQEGARGTKTEGGGSRHNNTNRETKEEEEREPCCGGRGACPLEALDGAESSTQLQHQQKG